MADNTQSGGIGFCGMLTILFVGLKLTNYIAWSWLWVLSPLWLPFAVIVSVFFIAWTLATVIGKL